MRGQFEAVKQVDSATLDGLEMRVITLLKVIKQNSKSDEFTRQQPEVRCFSGPTSPRPEDDPFTFKTVGRTSHALASATTMIETSDEGEKQRNSIGCYFSPENLKSKAAEYGPFAIAQQPDPFQVALEPRCSNPENLRTQSKTPWLTMPVNLTLDKIIVTESRNF